MKCSFLGSCDRFRQTEVGEKEWQRMMREKRRISEKEFLRNVDVNIVLDEGETWSEYKENARLQGDPIKYYKSRDKYFFQTAGFEFIWKKN